MIGDPLGGAEQIGLYAGGQTYSLDRKCGRTIRIDRPIAYLSRCDTDLRLRQRLRIVASVSNRVRNSVGRLWAALDVPDRSQGCNGLANMPLGRRECSSFDQSYDRHSVARAFDKRKERSGDVDALDWSSLVSAHDSFEHYPPCLINEIIVDRIVSSEHSIDQRPVERVYKRFQVEIG
jgi:hypothetical protein